MNERPDDREDDDIIFMAQLVDQLYLLIEEFGANSNEVGAFVQKHSENNPEFEELAQMYLDNTGLFRELAMREENIRLGLREQYQAAMRGFFAGDEWMLETLEEQYENDPALKALSIILRKMLNEQMRSLRKEELLPYSVNDEPEDPGQWWLRGEEAPEL
jgi:hypothetical protein